MAERVQFDSFGAPIFDPNRFQANEIPSFFGAVDQAGSNFASGVQGQRQQVNQDIDNLLRALGRLDLVRQAGFGNRPPREFGSGTTVNPPQQEGFGPFDEPGMEDILRGLQENLIAPAVEGTRKSFEGVQFFGPNRDPSTLVPEMLKDPEFQQDLLRNARGLVTDPNTGEVNALSLLGLPQFAEFLRENPVTGPFVDFAQNVFGLDPVVAEGELPPVDPQEVAELRALLGNMGGLSPQLAAAIGVGGGTGGGPQESNMSIPGAPPLTDAPDRPIPPSIDERIAEALASLEGTRPDDPGLMAGVGGAARAIVGADARTSLGDLLLAASVGFRDEIQGQADAQTEFDRQMVAQRLELENLQDQRELQQQEAQFQNAMADFELERQARAARQPQVQALGNGGLAIITRDEDGNTNLKTVTQQTMKNKLEAMKLLRELNPSGSSVLVGGEFVDLNELPVETRGSFRLAASALNGFIPTTVPDPNNPEKLISLRDWALAAARNELNAGSEATTLATRNVDFQELEMRAMSKLMQLLASNDRVFARAMQDFAQQRTFGQGLTLEQLQQQLGIQ